MRKDTGLIVIEIDLNTLVQPNEEEQDDEVVQVFTGGNEDDSKK